MFAPVFPCVPLHEGLLDNLLAAMGSGCAIWGPHVGADGVNRLQPMTEAQLPDLATLTCLPLKKLLLPPGEALWSCRDGGFHRVADPTPCVVTGVPLCDLQALWYLDRVFADDAAYQARRTRLLVLGAACAATPDCRCDGRLMPVAGDIFVTREQVWALSAAGLQLLQQAGGRTMIKRSLPWPDLPVMVPCRPEDVDLPEAADSVWQEEARRCLACGACAAVCPTCYCFDMLDTVQLDGQVERTRHWDNCFFAEHGKVAGGHDFRPTRGHRLHFRMDHKLNGFGSLRGQNSCVGCGRCRSACPVDIDLDRIAARLGEAVPS